jgi:RNA polymerase sigma-70 factor (ECF subfamily)
LNDQIYHSEALLTAQLIGGDRGAFDAIYNRFYEAVYCNAFSILKDSAAAEDIVQEVFLTLWQKKIHSFTRKISRVGYL